MKHITQENNVQAYRIEIAGAMAVLFYTGVGGTVIEDLKLPAEFKVLSEFTPKHFSWCDWMVDYINLFHDQENSKENMALRKLLYCLEDECLYLCDYTTYNDYVVGIVYPDTLDLSNNRLDFGFCDEECFFGILSDRVEPIVPRKPISIDEIKYFWENKEKVKRLEP